LFRIYYINYSTTNVIVLLPAHDGAVVDFFIVYTHHVSPLTTVKSQATNVPVQVVYQALFVKQVILSQETNVQVQVVYQQPLLSWLLFVGIACFTAYI
jgi:hypothetical protein